MNNINHCISKAILKFAVENGVSVMDFENLTGIRDRTNNNLRNKQKYLHNSSGLLTNYNNSLSLK
jgi:hypothetical protein